MSDPYLSQAAQTALDQAIGVAGQTVAEMSEASANLVYRRWVTVLAVIDGPPTTANVRLGATEIPGVAVLSSYDVQAGDTAILDLVGSDPLLIGSAGLTSTGTSTPAPSDPSVPIDPGTGQPIDETTPGAPVVTLYSGLGMVIVTWQPVLTSGGSEVGEYQVQIATDPYFADPAAAPITTSGCVVSFLNLQASTYYYVQVQATSYAGVVGPESLIQDIETPSAAGASATVAIIGTAAISSAMIASLTAGSITSGTINAQNITLGTSGGTAAIQSSNYVYGSTGWAILGDGTAQFTNAVILNATWSGTVTSAAIDLPVISAGVVVNYGIANQGIVNWGNGQAYIVAQSNGTNVPLQIYASGGLTVTGAQLNAGSINVYGANFWSQSGNFIGGNPGAPGEVSLWEYYGTSNLQLFKLVSGGTGNTSAYFPYGIPALSGGLEVVIVSASQELGVPTSLSKYKTNVRPLADDGLGGGDNPVWKLRPVRFLYTEEVTSKAVYHGPMGYKDDPRPEDPDFLPKIEPCEESGFILEEMMAVCDHLAINGFDGTPAAWPVRPMIAYLVDAVQHLRDRVVELETKAAA